MMIIIVPVQNMTPFNTTACGLHFGGADTSSDRAAGNSAMGARGASLACFLLLLLRVLGRSGAYRGSSGSGMVGILGGGGASSSSGTSLSSSRSSGNRSQSLMNELGTSAGSSLWWNCCWCLRAPSCGDSEARVGHEGKAQARLLASGQAESVHEAPCRESEYSDAKEEAREDEGELESREGQPMEMGDEEALGEAMVGGGRWTSGYVEGVER